MHFDGNMDVKTQNIPAEGSRAHFLQIAPEIRQYIMKDVFESTQLVVQQFGPSTSEGVIAKIFDHPALRFVCRQLDREARPLVFESLTVVVKTLFFSSNQIPSSMRDTCLGGIRHLLLDVYKSWDWPAFDPRSLPALETLTIREHRISHKYSTLVRGGETIVNQWLNSQHDQDLLQELVQKRNEWRTQQTRWPDAIFNDNVPNMCVIGANQQRGFRIILDSCSFVRFLWGGTERGYIYVAWMVDLDTTEIFQRKALLDRRGRRPTLGIDWRAMFAAHEDGDIFEKRVPTVYQIIPGDSRRCRTPVTVGYWPGTLFRRSWSE